MLYLGYVKPKVNPATGVKEPKIDWERDIAKLIKDGQAKHSAQQA